MATITATYILMAAARELAAAAGDVTTASDCMRSARMFGADADHRPVPDAVAQLVRSSPGGRFAQPVTPKRPDLVPLVDAVVRSGRHAIVATHLRAALTSAMLHTEGPWRSVDHDRGGFKLAMAQAWSPHTHVDAYMESCDPQPARWSSEVAGAMVGAITDITIGWMLTEDEAFMDDLAATGSDSITAWCESYAPVILDDFGDHLRTIGVID